MRPVIWALPIALLAAGLGLGQTRITAVRFWSVGEVTRIAIETDGETGYHAERLDNPDRLFFDLQGTRPQGKGLETIPVGDRLLKQIRIARTLPGVTRVVLDLASPIEYSVSHLSNPDRIMVELRLVGKGPATPPVRSVTGITDCGAGPRGNGERARDEARSGGGAGEAPAGTDGVPHASRARGGDVAASTGAAEFATDEAPRIQAAPSTGEYSACAGAARCGIETGGPGGTAGAYAARCRGETGGRNDARGCAPRCRAEAGGRDEERSGSRAGGAAGQPRRPVDDPGAGVEAGACGAGSGPRGARCRNGRPGRPGGEGAGLGRGAASGCPDYAAAGSEVIFTRTDDTYVPLEARTALANEKHADLFLSIHANSSRLRGISGSEAYHLNFTTSASAMEVAARENAGSEESIHELQSLLQKIALKEKVQESRSSRPPYRGASMPASGTPKGSRTGASSRPPSWC